MIILTGDIRTPSTTASFLVFVEKKVLLKSHLNSTRREGWRCSESEWVDKIQRNTLGQEDLWSGHKGPENVVSARQTILS